jgi:hypothetical protein
VQSSFDTEPRTRLPAKLAGVVLASLALLLIGGCARYEEEYVRINGEWKIQNLALIQNFWTPFDQGWVKKPFMGQ